VLIKSAFTFTEPFVHGAAFNLNFSFSTLTLQVLIKFKRFNNSTVLLRFTNSICKSFILLLVLRL